MSEARTACCISWTNTKQSFASLVGMSVMSLSRAAPYRVSGWTELESLFGEWWHRARSRYELESLSERDLADMGMTRIDAFNEIQKPFWQA